MSGNDASFQLIDMDHYPRKAHFDYFRSLPYPYVGTTVNADVTGVLRYSRRRGRSFYLTFLHAAALAADSVPELRRRIRGNGIAEYAECPTSHTEMTAGGTYCYCTLRHHMNLDSYYRQAEEARAACRSGGITEDEDVERMYFVSTLPWLHYTALIQPVAAGDESNPRITWGRYETDAAGRTVMPVTLLVHHALADGIHLAAFYERLAEQIRSFETAE